MNVHNNWRVHSNACIGRRQRAATDDMGQSRCNPVAYPQNSNALRKCAPSHRFQRHIAMSHEHCALLLAPDA